MALSVNKNLTFEGILGLLPLLVVIGGGYAAISSSIAKHDERISMLEMSQKENLSRAKETEVNQALERERLARVEQKLTDVDQGVQSLIAKVDALGAARR